MVHYIICIVYIMEKNIQQDLAGNLVEVEAPNPLSVKITTSTYDPVASRLVEQFAEKITTGTHAVPLVVEVKGLSPSVFPSPPALTRSRGASVYDA